MKRHFGRFSMLRAVAFVALLGTVQIAALARAEEPHPGGRIAFVRDGSVWVWKEGHVARLVKSDSISDARWSPDGAELLYVTSGNSFSDLALYTVATGVETRITDFQPEGEEGTPEYAAEASWAIDPSWSASGLIGFISDVASSDNSLGLWLMSDVQAGPSYAPVAVSEDNIDSLDLSPDGSIAAYVVRTRRDDGTSAVGSILRDLIDGTTYSLLDIPQDVFDPAFSPNGRNLAVTVRGGDGQTDIWIVSRDTGTSTRVTTGFDAGNACWSPDGAWLAFTRVVDFKFEVWVVPMQGIVPGTPSKLFRSKDFDAPSGISWTATTG